MKERHIILRCTHPPATARLRAAAPRSAAAGPASRALPPLDALSIHVDELDSRDVSKLAGQADTVLVSPAIPMQLIAPVRRDATPAAGAAKSPPWGIAAVRADTSPCSGNDVTVAILDTGIDRKHPAFRSKLKVVEKDFTGGGNGDTNGHGTHCAGTILGRDVDGVRIGVARRVSRALIGKVLGSGGGSSDQIVQAMNWAVDQSADVISMSLGIDFAGMVKRYENSGYPPGIAASKALEGFRLNVRLFEAVAASIRARGAFGSAPVIVAASGNESQRNVRPDFTVAVDVPGVSDGILSVAAVGTGPKGWVVAAFSNANATFSAPGVDIVSARPGGGFATMSGTSMATPHAAGIAALWVEQLRSTGQFTPAAVAARLCGSATTTGLAPGFQTVDVGLGMLTAPQ